MIHIATVVGARPQFVKAAALSRIVAADGALRESLIHTGQHYDPELSDVFFAELQIPPPKLSLGVGSASHGAQTGEMLIRLERALEELRPDVVLLYGDTNSTLAGGLAAAKLQIPIAHVEAGLRSYNRAMPEEINRVLVDHLSALLFCPTTAAVANLAKEGVRGGVSHVGDVMYDLALRIAPIAEQRAVLRGDPRLRAGYAVATIHRAENTDSPDRLRSIVEGLRLVAKDRALVLPVHPRTRAKLAAGGIDLGEIVALDPLGFIDMTYLVRHASVVVTDSGGLQKEAYFHSIPCVTVRDETEWVETVTAGWNRLVGADDPTALAREVERAATAPRPNTTISEYGDGNACAAIVAAIRASIRGR